MPRSLRTIVVLLLLASACEPPSVSQSVDVEDVTLTAELPVVAYEVRACVTGEPPNALDVYVSFGAIAFTNEGSVELTVESLSDEAGDDRYDPELDQTTVRSDDGYGVGIHLVADAKWDTPGTRCSEPEVVQISVPELAEGQEVSLIDIGASISAQWAGGACGGEFQEDWLSLEVERL